MCWQKEQPLKPTKPNTLPETIQYKGRKCNSLSKFFHGNYPQPSDVLRGSRCSHSRSCADVGENVKSVDGYSQRSQHVSMIHKRHTHTHTHQLVPSADTSASCLYSNLHSVTVGHRRVLYARSAKAQRPAAMLCVCRDVSAFDARGQMNQKKNKLLQYWQRNAASLLPPTEQG